MLENSLQSSQTIPNQSIVERIVEQITQAIIRGDLKPGDKIPTEVALIEELGVGRNSVREAIKMLSALGILEIRRGDGTYICKKISPSILDSLVYSILMEQSTSEEMLELRKTLEIDILELAVEKATDEDISRLEELMAEFYRVFAIKDYEAAAALDLAFHRLLVDIARNPLLSKIVKGVLDLFYPSVQKTLIKFEGPKGGANFSHQDMIEILRCRDKGRIPEVVERSLEGWGHYVKT